MKKQLRLILVLVGTLPLTIVTGCNYEFPDYYHEKVFDIENFEGVKLGDAFQIEIRQAEEFSVIAKGENRDLNDLQLEVVNGVLLGSYRPGSRNHKQTLIQISMPVLKSARLSAASSSKISGFHDPAINLFLKVSGASRVVTESRWNFLDLQIAGASELVFKGQAENLEAKVNGASRLQGAELSAKKIKIEVGGTSEASVTVTENLSGKVNGHSLLKYQGSPESLNVEVAMDSRMIRS